MVLVCWLTQQVTIASIALQRQLPPCIHLYSLVRFGVQIRPGATIPRFFSVRCFSMRPGYTDYAGDGSDMSTRFSLVETRWVDLLSMSEQYHHSDDHVSQGANGYKFKWWPNSLRPLEGLASVFLFFLSLSLPLTPIRAQTWWDRRVDHKCDRPLTAVQELVQAVMDHEEMLVGQYKTTSSTHLFSWPYLIRLNSIHPIWGLQVFGSIGGWMISMIDLYLYALKSHTASLRQPVLRTHILTGTRRSEALTLTEWWLVLRRCRSLNWSIGFNFRMAQFCI